MRKLLTAAFAALAVLAVASCTKPDPDSLTITSSEIRFTNEGGSQTISFSANVAWTATADQSWITLSAASGEAGNASIKVTVDENPDYSTRTGNITIVAGSLTSTYKVTQTEMAVFSPGAVNTVDAAAQQVAISVTSNQDYTVNIEESAKSWIKVASTKSAPVTKQITLQIAANDGLQKRQGKVSVATAGNVFEYTIVQTCNFMESSLIGAAYVSNVQKVYDNDNYCLTTFGQYAVALASENGDAVAIMLNVSKEGVDKTALPEGEFTCNYEGDHAPGTFSTISLDGSEKQFTFIMTAEGDSIIVADGTIKIAKDGDNYSIAAALMDENEQIHSYSYVGPVAVEDRAIGLQVGSVSYIGDYYTYFVNDNSQWDFNFYVTEPIAADMPHIYNLGLSIFDGKGIVDPQAIPTGTFTITTEEYIESPYASGTLKIENGQALSNGGYADYNQEDDSYKNVTVKSGTVEISKADEYYNFAFDLAVTVTAWHYDEEWNTIIDSETDYNWTYTFKDVIMPKASDNQNRPQPDVDMEFTGAMSMQQGYQGMYYGDAYSLGGNMFVFGWAASIIENHYKCYIPVHTSSAWTYVKNWNNRYCSTPIPEGTYPYVTEKPTENGNFIANLKSAARKFYFTNDYTGSTVYIDKGSIKIEGEKIIVDAEGPITYADGTESEERLKFTGWIPNQIYFTLDYTKKQTQVAWAE